MRDYEAGGPPGLTPGQLHGQPHSQAPGIRPWVPVTAIQSCYDTWEKHYA